ncbi:hypothetical protein IFR04_005785 [Cadophora malorum]|uniref:Uncharacterized protein n=1 Tax=Cadophora malorum TaxID=108018 RepID=A0A8H7TKY4_9HELO|nr:hypothetical protein IFR04_005785 [Cadophora malorum]
MPSTGVKVGVTIAVVIMLILALGYVSYWWRQRGSEKKVAAGLGMDVPGEGYVAFPKNPGPAVLKYQMNLQKRQEADGTWNGNGERSGEV